MPDPSSWMDPFSRDITQSPYSSESLDAYGLADLERKWLNVKGGSDAVRLYRGLRDEIAKLKKQAPKDDIIPLLELLARRLRAICHGYGAMEP